MSEVRVLLVGYNGANNTGAEARLLAIVEDVRAVLGPDALVTVPTLSAANTRRYLREGPGLRIVPVPTVFPLALHRLVRQHDLVMLVEGSTYLDTWTSFLLWYFLWATRCAHAMGRPCLAYAVDAGHLSPFNRRCVRQEASKTTLIITRTHAAADRLRSWGVSAPIEVSADTAFTFCPNPADESASGQHGAGEGAVGLAVVDFYRWPVVLRLWGRREECYRWPYFFSSSPRRRAASAALVRGYAALADRVVAEHGRPVALFAMEELDEPLVRRIQRSMVHADRARVFSARCYNASQMALLLRGLDLLVTSRYHAGVLSLAGRVPQVAVGHDLRLKSFYDELRLPDRFFLDPRAPGLYDLLASRVAELLADPASQQATLERGYREHLERARRNRELLCAFVRARGWGRPP